MLCTAEACAVRSSLEPISGDSGEARPAVRSVCKAVQVRQLCGFHHMNSVFLCCTTKTTELDVFATRRSTCGYWDDEVKHLTDLVDCDDEEDEEDEDGPFAKWPPPTAEMFSRLALFLLRNAQAACVRKAAAGACSRLQQCAAKFPLANGNRLI